MANLLLAVIYIAFISLGLPDAVLGAAWPTMSGDLHAPISWAGGISMTISAGTIVSALLSDRMTLRFGAGKVTAVSVALTAFALFGFSISPNYWMLLPPTSTRSVPSFIRLWKEFSLRANDL